MSPADRGTAGGFVAVIERLGLPHGEPLAITPSDARFPDGAHFRIEIPSVEGPAVLREVVAAAREYDVPVVRVSQGSGISMLTDAEIREMAAIGHGEGIEVSLFVGPRAPWDVGAQVRMPGGAAIGWRLTGMDQLRFAYDDIARAADLGIRGVLVADEGLLWVVGEAIKMGALPSMVLKISALMGVSNPAAARLMADLGAGTINVPSDASVARLRAIREATDLPLDLYVESPDDLGGFVRYPEIPAIVAACAPVYLKSGVRNAASIYPVGGHLSNLAIQLGRERVRRARLAMEVVARAEVDLVWSAPNAPGLGVPTPR